MKQTFEEFMTEAVYNPLLWRINYDYQYVLSLIAEYDEDHMVFVYVSHFYDQLVFGRVTPTVNLHAVNLNNIKDPLSYAIDHYGLTFLQAMIGLDMIKNYEEISKYLV